MLSLHPALEEHPHIECAASSDIVLCQHGFPCREEGMHGCGKG